MPQYRSIYEPHPVGAIVTDPASTIIAASLDSPTRERINTAVKSVRDVARECWSDLDVYGPYAKSGGYRAFKLSHDSWEAILEQTDIGDETIDIAGEE